MARQPQPAMISDVNFDEDPERDEITIVMLSSDLGFTIDYAVFKDSIEATEPNGMTILRADLSDLEVGRTFSSLALEIYIYDRGSGIESRVKYRSEVVSHFEGYITEDAKKTLIDFFKGTPSFDPSTLPKVKVPKGQADYIFWAPIEDGTVMADFKNERDGFHRYYTKEGMDRMNPLVNMGTNLPLQQSDITYYIAELDDSMQPTFTGEAEGGRRGRRRKTLRERRRTPRNKRRST
jgi:hypothetical protein